MLTPYEQISDSAIEFLSNVGDQGHRTESATPAREAEAGVATARAGVRWIALRVESLARQLQALVCQSF